MPFPYPCEIVSGKTALEWFEAMRELEDTTPVILGGSEQFESIQENFNIVEDSPQRLLEQAASLDPEIWLQEREQEDAESYELKASEWPEESASNDALSAHLDVMSREPLDEVYITMLPTSDAWAAACYLKIGGWNSMPNAHEHSALWKHWEAQYGAKVACIADDVIEFTVTHPPKTREEAMTLAHQQYIYCPDIVHQGMGSLEALAGTLINSSVWYFWWD